MGKKNILILIPARFQSTRFPGKPLAKIKERPMIQWVYERVCSNNHEKYNLETFVVTDHEKVEKCVQEFGGNVLFVADETESGTERIALAVDRNFKQQNFDLIINVQGDEPLIEMEIIENLIDFHLESDFDIATVVRKDLTIGGDPNSVKAIFCKGSGRCLYFSRSKVPFDRNNYGEEFFCHVGIYSYRPNALKRFCQLPIGYYEKMESLEQLRALENGLTIGAIEIIKILQGVDTPEDIKKVEERLNV